MKIAGEVDFVADTGEQIISIEVKAEVNLKATSLKTYREKYSPEISIRTSMADYKKVFMNLYREHLHLQMYRK